LLETQVLALEEGKKLLSLEVDQLKRNLEDTQRDLNEQEVLLNKSTERTKKVELENSNLKSSLDELKTQNQVPRKR